MRPTIVNLVEVISLPLWPITCISLACTGGWLQTVCRVECRVLMKLLSDWKRLMGRQVTIPMRRRILIGLDPESTVLASGSS